MTRNAWPILVFSVMRKHCSERSRQRRLRSERSTGSPATRTVWSALRSAHAQARGHTWQLLGAPARLDIDVDATLPTAHSEKAGAAENFKRGFGFHPLVAYGDQTEEAMSGVLCPGNTNANTTTYHIQITKQTLKQIHNKHIKNLTIMLHSDNTNNNH